MENGVMQGRIGEGFQYRKVNGTDLKYIRVLFRRDSSKTMKNKTIQSTRDVQIIKRTIDDL